MYSLYKSIIHFINHASTEECIPAIKPQINRLDPLDAKWDALRNIPEKEYDPIDGVTYVYISINGTNKDFYITYSQDDDNICDFQIQTFMNDDVDNRVWGLEGHMYVWDREAPHIPPQYSFRPSILANEGMCLHFEDFICAE